MFHIGALVLCSLIAPVDTGEGITVLTNVTMTGKILSMSLNRLIVDFSKDAKKLHIKSEYKSTLIHKNLCVEK